METPTGFPAFYSNAHAKAEVCVAEKQCWGLQPQKSRFPFQEDEKKEVLFGRNVYSAKKKRKKKVETVMWRIQSQSEGDMKWDQVFFWRYNWIKSVCFSFSVII